MKIFYYSVLILIMFNSCGSPGSLGVGPEISVDIPFYQLEDKLDFLSKHQLKINDSDSSNYNWWNDNGYDFLKYKCFKIKKTIYIVTLSDENDETTIYIRALLNSNSDNWIFAKEFRGIDEEKSEKALEILEYYIIK